MSHKKVAVNDRIVLLATVLAGLALVGAATGVGAEFLGGLIETVLGAITGGGGGLGGIGDALVEAITSLFG